MTLDDNLLLWIVAATLGLCALGLSWFAGSDAPYVPTSLHRIPEILKKSGLKKDQIFYELGSGDGRVVFEAAKLGAQAFGIEQSWLRVWYARFKARKLQSQNAHFYHGNIFEREYFPADVIYIYLLQPAIDRLEVKLKKELKRGAVVITQTYHFRNWRPFRTIGEFNFYRIST